MARKYEAKLATDEDEELTTGLFDFSDEEKEEKNDDQERMHSDNEEHLEEDSDNKASDESDSDDAPEDVSFHTGKESAMAQIKNMLQVIKGDKHRLKEKRKKTDELYKAQKKKRLDYLAKRRLPDDVVANLKTPVPRGIGAGVGAGASDDDSDDAEAPEHEEDEIVIHPSLLSRGADFLPFDASKPYARTMRDVTRVERSSKAALLEFKQKALYGGRIPRQSVKATLAQREKRNVARKRTVPTR